MSVEEQNVKKNIWGLLNKRIKLISFLVFVLIGVIIYIFLMGPSMQRLKQTKQAIAVIKKDKQKIEDIITRVNKNIKEYKEIKKDNDNKINNVLVNGDNIANLIVQLNSLAKENGFSVQYLNFSKQYPKNNGKGKRFIIGLPGFMPREFKGNSDLGVLQNDLTALDIKFACQFTGDYIAFKNLLFSLENFARITDVISFNYSFLKRDIVFKLRTYFIQD
jgi:preprotein translocase subunit YajC